MRNGTISANPDGPARPVVWKARSPGEVHRKLPRANAGAAASGTCSGKGRTRRSGAEHGSGAIEHRTRPTRWRGQQLQPRWAVAAEVVREGQGSGTTAA